ncbi:MAG: DUF3050 domain-containing protein [Planctomycetaceae bacterium]
METLSPHFEQLQQNLAPLKNRLIDHDIYRRIDDPASLRIFMEHHVFAVWDFMSLLKSLQRRLSCVDVPWVPADSSLGARLVNEIVLGEETDEDGHGGYASHFELYYRAMQQAGADVSTVDRFLSVLRVERNLSQAMKRADLPQSVGRFVEETFRLIDGGDIRAMASAFLFGREDLLPDVFRRIVEEMNNESGLCLDEFLFYLNRHIELDGDEHGPLAAKLLTELCGDDAESWSIAEAAAQRAFKARTQLWDDVCNTLDQSLAA